MQEEKDLVLEKDQDYEKQKDKWNSRATNL